MAKEKKKTVGLRMPESMHWEIKRRAEKQFHTFSSYTLLLLSKQLEKDKTSEKTS